MTKRTYRKRPVRIPTKTSKPLVINNDETASLLDWLRCYSQFRHPATVKMWFANSKFSQKELRQVYDAGLHAVAIELGFLPYRKPETVDFSQPIVTSIAPPEAVKVAA